MPVDEDLVAVLGAELEGDLDGLVAAAACDFLDALEGILERGCHCNRVLCSTCSSCSTVAEAERVRVVKRLTPRNWKNRR